MLSVKLSQRARETEPFRAMELMARAGELAEAGHDIIHMEVGEPDFPTAAPIVRAGQEALGKGLTGYTDAPGILPLREKIAGWYARQYGVNLHPDRILVTTGGSGGLLLCAACLVEPGHGVLLQDPGYPCNRSFIRQMGGKPQLVRADAGSRWQMSAASLAGAWNSETRGALLASPSNPTGTVIRPGELQGIIGELERRQGYLIMDEIYHGLTYGEDHPVSSVLALTNDAFVINSFSKYFGMTGWRLGWLVAPEAAVPALTRLAQNLFISAPTVAQYAALAAFSDESMAIFEERRLEFFARRELLWPALTNMGFQLAGERSSGGAFYFYARLPEGAPDAMEFCRLLLESRDILNLVNIRVIAKNLGVLMIFKIKNSLKQ